MPQSPPKGAPVLVDQEKTAMPAGSRREEGEQKTSFETTKKTYRFEGEEIADLPVDSGRRQLRGQMSTACKGREESTYRGGTPK